MTEDFFAELGETISKTAKDISDKADGFFESQKARTKIISEQRMIDKALGDMGNVIYQKYVDGQAIDEELLPLCEDITQRKVAIAKYREEMAKMKGQKVCAACGATVPMEAVFCMQCGAPCKGDEEGCGCGCEEAAEDREESCCCKEGTEGSEESCCCKEGAEGSEESCCCNEGDKSKEDSCCCKDETK